jgi:mRNA interferase MazF
MAARRHSRHIPERGDLIWINFDPQTGHEQKGRRPAAVLSRSEYNRKSGLVVVCPVTNQVKNYPFEVALPATLEVTGVVLADQLKSMDWQRRNAGFLGRLPEEVMQEIVEKACALIDPEPDTGNP